jgi:hypothetical protein
VVITSLGDVKDLQPVSVFPNPGTGIFTVEAGDLKHSQAALVNKWGQESAAVELQSVGNNRYQLNLSSMADGVYIIRLQLRHGIKMIRVVKVN